MAAHMGPSWRPSFSLPLLVLAAALLSGSAEAAAAQLHRHRGGVATLCGHTSYPAPCLAAARRVRGRPVGPAALTEATIQAAVEKVHVARAVASRLQAASRSHDKMAKSNLETCRQSYASALYDLKTSMTALRRQSIADLQINLSAAMTDVGTCDDGFTMDAGRRSPLAGVNHVIHKLASNGLALSDMMHKRHH